MGFSRLTEVIFSLYNAAPGKPEAQNYGAQACPMGETQVRDTKVRLGIPIATPHFFVLTCVWKHSPQLFVLPRGFRDGTAVKQMAGLSPIAYVPWSII